MADDKPDDHVSSRGAVPDGGRAKRPGPTIDVEAVRVERNDDAAAKAAGDKPGNDKVEPAGPDAGKPATPSSAPANSVNPGASVPPGGTKRTFGAASASAARPDAKPAADQSATAQPRAGTSLVVAGTVGAMSGVVAAAILFGIGASSGWLRGPAPEPVTIPPPEVRSADLAALAGRVTKIEAQPAAPAQAAAAPAGPDPVAAARIDDLEKQVASLRDGLAAARAEADKAKAEAGGLTAAVDGLKAAPTPAPVDLSGITTRLGAIERATSALKTEATQLRDKPADDGPLRKVVATSMLDAAVRQGEPYADALTAVRSLVANPDVLKPLEAFAATGVPTRADMLRDLQTVLPTLSSAPAPIAPNAGWLDRLGAGAMRLVRIKRTDGNAADNQAVAVDRVTAAAKRGDISAARSEINNLAPVDKAKVQAWADRFDARRAALAASQQLAAEASASLNKPAQ